jgi:hypothetical protein
LLAPGSQHKPAPYRTETVNGKLGFVSDFDTETMGLQRYSGGLGEPVPFNYNTLHVGSLNRSEKCPRVLRSRSCSRLRPERREADQPTSTVRILLTTAASSGRR